MTSIVWIMVLGMLAFNTIILSILAGYILARRGQGK
jgi:hypothetical protein